MPINRLIGAIRLWLDAKIRKVSAEFDGLIDFRKQMTKGQMT